MSKSKEAEAPQKILKYMTGQNRPYSVTDVLNNMHKEFGKTCVTKVMEQLATEGKLVEKVYGKQKVYVVNQSLLPSVSDEELRALEDRISLSQKELTESKEMCKVLQSELHALTSSLTTEEARGQLVKLREECKVMQARIDKLKSGVGNLDPKDVVKTERKYETSLKEWRKRKRMSMDMINTILEGYPKSKKMFYEEVGIETDEEVGVQFPKI